MTDQELLRLAAKAAGFEGVITEYQNGYCEMGLTNHFKLDGSNVWTPLHNDGDALRLAVKLYMDIEILGGAAQITYVMGHDDYRCNVGMNEGDCGGDLCRATRRAIVRAAAAIGEQMP